MCNECKDGTDNVYGCCNDLPCSIQQFNGTDELQCREPSTIRFEICDYAFGGIAGIQCEEGFICEDDPRDDCDPLNGGADCGGICVESGIYKLITFLCSSNVYTQYMMELTMHRCCYSGSFVWNRLFNDLWHSKVFGLF